MVITVLQTRCMAGVVVAVLLLTGGCRGTLGRFWPGEETALPVPLERAAAGAVKNIPEPEITQQNFAAVQLAMAESFERDGNRQAALAAYHAAVRNSPNLAHAHHRIALLSERTGCGENSVGHFRKALELDPNNAEVHCDFGYCCYLRGRYDEADKHFRRALEINPMLSRAHNNLGLLLARDGHSSAALQQFAKAGLSPAQAHTNLGFVNLTERRISQARTHLQQAIAADPDFENAKTMLTSADELERREENHEATAQFASAAPLAAENNPPGAVGQIGNVDSSPESPPSDSRYARRLRRLPPPSSL